MKMLFRWIWLAVLTVIADQGSKFLLSARLPPFQPVHVMPSLNLYLTWNSGISFSFLQMPGDWQRWPLAAFQLFMAVALLVWLMRLKPGRWLLAGAISIILGGAVGNLIDRVSMGKVTDFIQVYYGDWSFAVFNVADAAISVGVALILLDSLLADRKARKAA